MTEAEWLACAHSKPMLEFLRGKVSDRNLRLFACGCCRRLLHLMPDKRSRTALEVAERVADGLVSGPAEREAAWQVRLGLPHDHTGWALQPDAFIAARSGAEHLADAVRMQQKPLRRHEAWLKERGSQALLIRCVFGNPFRPATAEPGWLTSDVLALATGIYAERAFDRLPILADALQDAGCDRDDVLNHLRGDGPHVLGCWVLDLVLGKS
ncbi:hypothetical protein R5W24_006191 [Gemmata sp. JC717]|uniref:hypothetical protein n=1 Tax=Gemmata algarum TaxID=2975278 RepID=UPI0021BA7E63|nr:hypothetical protein [Gemmata algarum]MDY3557008.1 hypothetical protein [Gemmata algarum]